MVFVRESFPHQSILVRSREAIISLVQCQVNIAARRNTPTVQNRFAFLDAALRCHGEEKLFFRFVNYMVHFDQTLWAHCNCKTCKFAFHVSLHFKHSKRIMHLWTYHRHISSIELSFTGSVLEKYPCQFSAFRIEYCRIVLFFFS